MKFKSSACLLFILNYISENCSYTIQEAIKESLEKGLNSLTQLRRQFPDELDDDSSELMGNADKEDLMRYELSIPGFTPSSSPPVDVTEKANSTTSATKLTTTITIKNCTCKFHASSATGNHDGKPGCGANIQQHSTENHANTTNEPNATTMPDHMSTIGTNYLSREQLLNETNFELRDLELQLDAAMKDVCPHYKDIPDLDIEFMADMWQLSYYKTKDPLLCFKIFMQHTTTQSRKRLKQKYTTFNDTIVWQECLLELISTGKSRNKSRRHFLQGSKSDNGVLENIVLSESNENGSKVITLQDQIPDQWMVTKNLLLMRDCDTGDVIIFNRATSNPEWTEMVDAMNAFGENGMNDTKLCKTPSPKKVDKKYDIRNVNYNILS